MASEKEKMTFEKEKDAAELMTEQIGFGRWTVLMASSYICWALVLPYFSLGGAFLNPTVDHWCQPQNVTELLGNSTDITLPEFLNETTVIWEDKDGFSKPSSCEEYDVVKWIRNSYSDSNYSKSETWNEENFPRKTCTSWNYDQTTFSSTVTTEWDLVCSSSGISPFFQSFYYFGVTLGEPLLGHLSDKMGRRWTLTRIWFLFLFCSVTSVLAPNFPLLLAMRFCLGIVHSASSVSYVLILETCPSKYRSLVGLFCTTVFSLTGVTFGCLAYYIRDWKYLQAVCILPGLLHVLYIPFIDESPRWLMNNNRLEEAIAVFQRAARWQKTELIIPNNLPVSKIPEADISSDSFSLGTPMEIIKPLLKDFLLLFSSSAMRRISFAMFGCWFVAGLSYWGMSLAGGTFSSDPFLYMILQSLMEIPGYTWFIPLLYIIGRKTILAINFLTCAVCMLTIPFLPKDLIWLTFTLALVGKFFITASYNLLYLYSVELFPTCARSRGLNVSSMMARIASISSPFVVSSMTHSHSWLPSVVFGSAAALGTVLSSFLPESKDKPLLDTVEQVQELYGKQSNRNRRRDIIA